LSWSALFPLGWALWSRYRAWWVRAAAGLRVQLDPLILPGRLRRPGGPARHAV